MRNPLRRAVAIPTTPTGMSCEWKVMPEAVIARDSLSLESRLNTMMLEIRVDMGKVTRSKTGRAAIRNCATMEIGTPRFTTKSVN